MPSKLATLITKLKQRQHQFRADMKDLEAKQQIKQIKAHVS